ncbi:iron-containing alcohol dehydrogenase [Candidatus Nitrosotenuis sp. DW1]|uniref:iron-containing alcohol dehydrogenase n=1 Tax=Candidatus Nitrosotenuis sp. DW1 TaxID=2259672 RepID=UPI0015CCA3D6|nr:iron-containing alcohol dehydrogenase [Candidatus Nitrosotenuis sp. DW1]QLH09672.1 iron-containing alcohol dehydrogenase [Candidatus Nitrosotenuis sp. DW1]
MFTIKQPPAIIFGKHSARDYDLPEDSLVITSKGAKSRGWIDYTSLNNAYIFDNIEPNPSMETVEKIIGEFGSQNFSHVVGIGGGSSLDVAKFVAFRLKKQKIMIPTTFGSGSEVTRISVLKVNGKKQSFHDDGILADVAIVDSFFIESSSDEVIKNSAIDACAQSTEGYDSKSGNVYTKFLCKTAFDLLENGILNNKKENIVLGSLYAGLGFGNCSTTLGHALSYVYSNEGYSHGHALAFTTTAAHKFNQSIFFDRFVNIVKKLNFTKITLKQSLSEAADIILTDKKHLDNNPKSVTKNDIVVLLSSINSS